MDKYSFQIRVTGLLLREDEILLVKQHISSSRDWSLPGGKAEAGETLEAAIIRELYEETGLNVSVVRLLYVCDKPDSIPPVLHITFLLEYISGSLRLPSNEFDSNPISDVRWIRLSELNSLGFTEKFISLVKAGFPRSGNYMGLKQNIGL